MNIQPSSTSRELTVLNHLHRMKYVYKRPKFDPHDLTNAHAARKKTVSQRLMTYPLDDRIWRRIITSDEK